MKNKNKLYFFINNETRLTKKYGQLVKIIFI